MPNSITAQAAVTTVLDEVYCAASLTGDLRTSNDLVRAGANAKEIMIPKIKVDGLGDYDRSSGYTSSAVTMEWETVAFDYDRGTKITVDAMDNDEANGVGPFVRAGSELERLHVAPEGDAYTFAKVVQCAGAECDVDKAGVTYDDAATLLKALSEASTKMDEGSVPQGRILYITPTLMGKINAYNQLTGDVDKANVMANFAKVVEVPQVRFYTAIDLADGKEKFGYSKAATGGKDLNWLIVHPTAVIKVDKHVASRIFNPDELEDLDAYMMKYRKYGLVDVYENKTVAVAYSHKA